MRRYTKRHRCRYPGQRFVESIKTGLTNLKRNVGEHVQHYLKNPSETELNQQLNAYHAPTGFTNNLRYHNPFTRAGRANLRWGLGTNLSHFAKNHLKLKSPARNTSYRYNLNKDLHTYHRNAPSGFFNNLTYHNPFTRTGRNNLLWGVGSKLYGYDPPTLDPKVPITSGPLKTPKPRVFHRKSFVPWDIDRSRHLISQIAEQITIPPTTLPTPGQKIVILSTFYAGLEGFAEEPFLVFLQVTDIEFTHQGYYTRFLGTPYALTKDMLFHNDFGSQLVLNKKLRQRRHYHGTPLLDKQCPLIAWQPVDDIIIRNGQNNEFTHRLDSENIFDFLRCLPPRNGGINTHAGEILDILDGTNEKHLRRTTSHVLHKSRTKKNTPSSVTTIDSAPLHHRISSFLHPLYESPER